MSVAQGSIPVSDSHAFSRKHTPCANATIDMTVSLASWFVPLWLKTRTTHSVVCFAIDLRSTPFSDHILSINKFEAGITDNKIIGFVIK